jgi:hypothetical protein
MCTSGPGSSGRWTSAKGGHGFAAQSQLEEYAGVILGQVRAVNMFAGRDRGGVVEGLMYTMQAVNIIHPFREGNGRTQRILTEHIAEHAGYLLDWHRIGPGEQNVVMARAFDGDLAPLREALELAVLPMFRGGSLEESQWATQPTVPASAPDFWQLDRTGTQVLVDARAQATQLADHAPVPRPAAGVEQQSDRGL